MDARLREGEISGLLGDWQGSLPHYQSILARQPQPEADSRPVTASAGLTSSCVSTSRRPRCWTASTAATDLPRSLWFSTQALMVEIALKQGQVPQAFARLRLAAQGFRLRGPRSGLRISRPACWSRPRFRNWSNWRPFTGITP